MSKSLVTTLSLSPHIQDIRTSIIRGHKYLRILKQFNENEDISKKDVADLLKKIKQVKTLRTLELQNNPYSDSQIKLGMVKLALKRHSARLRELHISNLPSQSSTRVKSILYSIKGLKKAYITNDISDIKALPCLKSVQSLFLNISNNKLATNFFQRVLTKLTNLKEVCLCVSPQYLNEILLVLDKFSTTQKPPITFKIVTKSGSGYNNPDLHLPIIQKVTKLSLKDINSDTVLQSLLSNQSLGLLNLKKLKLGFNFSNPEVISYFRYLKEIPFLEKLSLSFAGAWNADFSEGFLQNLKLPSLLHDLQINIPLSFKNQTEKYYSQVNENQGKNDKYPWRQISLFEENPTFNLFFQTLEQVRYLKKVKFVVQIVESFNSYYTNFFNSIFRRLPNISSLVLHVSDSTLEDNLPQHLPEPFDLTLFFQALCSTKKLENIEVLVPNLLIENNEIPFNMIHLKSFAVGVIENEEEGVFRYQNISNHVTGWLKKLVLLAPNLVSLILDFTEVIDEQAFFKRFMLIERLKHLEDFCSRFTISKCSTDTASKVGKAVQSLYKLKTIVIKFVESDHNTVEILKYFNYQKSLRDILFSFDQNNWIGKNCETISQTDEEEDEVFERAYSGSQGREASWTEIDDIFG